MCSNRVRKAKALLELNLEKDVHGNKKICYRYIGRKRKTRENMSSLINEAENLVPSVWKSLIKHSSA